MNYGKFRESTCIIESVWSGAVPLNHFFPGAIELSILSEHYGREIAAYDIQTTRCDIYGQVRLSDA